MASSRTAYFRAYYRAHKDKLNVRRRDRHRQRKDTWPTMEREVEAIRKRVIAEVVMVREVFPYPYR